MSGEVIILGGKGRFGRAAMAAFQHAGWRVRALVRGVAEDPRHVIGDAFDGDTVIKAAKDCDLIVNALNPPYPRWQRDLPRLTRSVIAAARATGTTVMLPGNVYNYGAGMPEKLLENTPHLPTTRKGRLRAKMEAAHAQADGVRTIVLRAGDFIERQATGNWFDSQISKNLAKGSVMYPGPLDRVHAWAYLPDMARAMAALAGNRDDFARFEDFGFPGYSLTGQALIDAIGAVAGRELGIKSLPWPLLRLLGLVMPQMREVAEMAYLWHTPHAIDGTKLAAALNDALNDALGDQKIMLPGGSVTRAVQF
ncbi:MAG: NAD-dependent epimerase/dehydratase family protein [Alphaproteobacteria bacterium]